MASDNNPLDILNKLTNKGDIAAASLGCVGGFVLDIALHLQGLASPNQASIYGAAAGIGIKNAIHSMLPSSRNKEKVAPGNSMENTYRRLREIFIERKASHRSISQLDQHFELWSLGLMTDQELLQKMRALAIDYTALAADA